MKKNIVYKKQKLIPKALIWLLIVRFLTWRVKRLHKLTDFAYKYGYKVNTSVKVNSSTNTNTKVTSTNKRKNKYRVK